MNKPSNWKTKFMHMRKKITLPLISLLFFAVMTIMGFGKTLFQIFCLISFHELFHIGCAMWFGYDITSIVIYPFGLGMYLEGMEVRHSLEEMVISMAGLVSYVFSMPLLSLLLHIDVISPVNYEWMRQINTSILLFNCLPIYPLDGGRILHGLCHIFLPFTWARRLTIVLSMGLLFVFSYLGIHSFSMLVIVLGFLGMQLVRSWLLLPMHRRQFYLHRYLHSCSYPPKTHSKSDLYRNHQNILQQNGRIFSEKAWLQEWMSGKARASDVGDQRRKKEPFF